ncbi:uncharacterized protein LOC127699715 [Mytilus californianus]|uniref:uncharacterized protein LOC127699715 n=1 Tax=Mytilus californianus TaxID=6549 RepID=UPI0022475D6F|nr:uncharacterized protein LOC127699715 [Mytilus californianus]
MYLFILINNPIAIVTGAVINLYIHMESIIGETVILPCENKQGNFSGVQWARRDKNTKIYFTTVYTDGWRVNTDLQIYERLKIVGARGGKDYGLQISSVTMLDSGLYRCAVDTKTNLTYHFVTLEVKDKYEDLRTVQFTTNIDDSRVFSSVPIVSILSIPSFIVVMLALIAAIRLCQTRHTNKVLCLPVNNQPVGIDEVQQSENHYDEIDYEEMSCEVQNNSLSDTSSYLIPVSGNVETILLNEENSLTGPSQEIDGNSQANVSEHTYDYSYVSNLYQPLTEHWGSYCRTYAQCPPCQPVSGYHNIADPSQICNMYQHLLPIREDAKHVYS